MLLEVRGEKHVHKMYTYAHTQSNIDLVDISGCMLSSRSVMSNSLWPHGLQHARLPVLHHLSEFAQIHVHWVGDAIQPSHPLLAASPPAFSLSQYQGLFQWSWLFASGGQSMGASTSASVLPMNSQGWFPLGLTGLISLLSKGLSGVYSSTTVRKHQFFGPQPRKSKGEGKPLCIQGKGRK